MLFQKIQKILNLDIRKTSPLKTRMRMRMSKKCGTSADADADIRPIPNMYHMQKLQRKKINLGIVQPFNPKLKD